MSTMTWLCFYVIFTVLFVNGQKYTSVIDTTSGPVRGLILNTIENISYAAFQGIPYAKPPLGYLRFKPPLEIDSWTDIYNATTVGNRCMQANLLQNRAPDGSEDCLYINVYTPHTSFNQSISKAVMVYIYGGGFATGGWNPTSYGPDYILGENVILVSFNYRLGAFGFLNLEHENATGNAGLKDQNLALKWVKKNIANFGGNPHNVTLFGGSAGASSIDFHALSDMSTGLFSQSICMSGSALNFYFGFQRRDEALQRAFLLGSKLGIKTMSKDLLLKGLYNTSAIKIAITTRAIGFFTFRPTLENPSIARDEKKFLTECAPVKFAISNYTKMPQMMGFTSDEAMTYLRDNQTYYNVGERILQLLEILPENVPFFANFKSTLANCKAVGIENTTQATINQLENYIGSLLFVLGVDAKHKFLSQNNNHPIYYYRFSFTPANSSLANTSGAEFEGAGHGDDQPYIFYNPTWGVPLNHSDVIITRKRVVKLWTNFAKYGNPTPNVENDELLGITWPDSRFDGAQLEIGTNLSIAYRQINNYVEILELFGLGGSLYYNDCANN